MDLDAHLALRSLFSGTLQELLIQRDELLEVLEFYADKENWVNGAVDIGVGDMEIPGSSECDNDGGRLAREIVTRIRESE